MRIYYDCEFSESGYGRVDLISIGMKRQDGAEYYAVAADGWSPDTCNDFVREHVLPQLGDSPRVTRAQIAADIIQFVEETRPDLATESARRRRALGGTLPTTAGVGRTYFAAPPEWWGYYVAYDHVLLSQLFGRMIDLPKGWPFFSRDIIQLCKHLGNPELPKQGPGEHNALADARHNKVMHEYLLAMGGQPHAQIVS